MTRMALIALLAVMPGIGHAQTTAVSGPDDTCGASGFQGLIGQQGQVARMLDLDRQMRVIGPDTAVTMDLRIDRINFDVDESDIITRIYCG